MSRLFKNNIFKPIFFRFDDNQKQEYDESCRKCLAEIEAEPAKKTSFSSERFSTSKLLSFKELRKITLRKTKNQFNLLNSLWFVVGSLMHQGSDVIPRAAATRTVAVIWYF